MSLSISPQAIQLCIGAKCEVNVGKPDPVMLETVMELLGLDAKDCVKTGDRLCTDVRIVLDASTPSAVVLTDETTAETLAAEPPENRPPASWTG